MTEQVNKPKRTRKVATPEPVVLAVESEALAMDKDEWNKIGDKQHPALDSWVVAMPIDKIETEDELKDQTNMINKHYLSGKRAGVVVYSKTQQALYCAKGREVKDTWQAQKASTAALTMGADPAKLQSTIGDVRRKSKHVAIPATSLTCVKSADLTNINHPINEHSISGKKLGAVVFDTDTGFIAMASGSNPSDKWISLGGTANDKTPAGVHLAGNVGKFTGETNHKAKNTIVACVDFPVYQTTDLAKKGHIINITSVSGKREGAIVIGIKNGSPDLYIADGSKDVSKWNPQLGGAASAITPAA